MPCYVMIYYMLAETMLAKVAVCSSWCNQCPCTTRPVQPEHVHVLTITHECSRESKPQPSTCNARACNGAPAQPVRANLSPWLLPTLRMGEGTVD